MARSRTASIRAAKFRDRQRAKGLRPATIWIPDIRDPAYRARLDAACRELADIFQPPKLKPMRQGDSQMPSSTCRDGSRAQAAATRHGSLGAAPRRQGSAGCGVTVRCARAPAVTPPWSPLRPPCMPSRTFVCGWRRRLRMACSNGRSDGRLATNHSDRAYGRNNWPSRSGHAGGDHGPRGRCPRHRRAACSGGTLTNPALPHESMTMWRCFGREASDRMKRRLKAAPARRAPQRS